MGHPGLDWLFGYREEALIYSTVSSQVYCSFNEKVTDHIKKQLLLVKQWQHPFKQNIFKKDQCFCT